MKKLMFFSLFTLFSTNAFSQWTFDAMIPNDSVHSPVMQYICVIDSTTSWAMGTFYISQNTQYPFFAKRNVNGWSYIPTDLDTDVKAFCFIATDSLNVWLGTHHPDNIYYSSNGGLNWSLQYHIADEGFVTGIIFCKQNKRIGYAFCDLTLNGGWNGVCILKTTNGGINWTRRNFEYSGYSCSDNSISVVDSNYAWFGADDLLSDNSKIIRTTNGGLNWIITDIVAGENAPFAIQFSDDKQTGLFVGQTYPATWFYRTTNSGLNWNVVYTTYDYYPKTLKWVPGTSIIYGNSESALVRSIDNGITWNQMSGIPETNLESIDAVRINQGTIYALAVTYNRRVYKLLDTARVLGIGITGFEIPKEFKLYQNYPNPFNPQTNIKYQIVNSGNVKLTIFDISGREVAILVNEKQSSGTYEVTFDAQNSASGIYFYELSTDEYTETRKMVLLK